MNLTVLGAGAWGTALAVSAAAQHPTCLWARDRAQAMQMATSRRNARYLDGVAFPTALQITSDFSSALAHAVTSAGGGLLVIATPMAGLGDVLRRLPPDAPPVLWLCKGFEQASGRLGHEIARDLCPNLSAGVLSGPSFALEVARGQPTALVVASSHPDLCERAVRALHGENLRVYTSFDPIGVEVGGAVKNVLAIATGIADGMAGGRADGMADGLAGPNDVCSSGLGLNARAALITRGLAEMTRLGVALGGRAETFMGLSGLGDLVLTATGHLSRNRQVGLLLAQGKALPQILADLGHVAAGVSTAPVLLQRARQAGVEMPIAEAVAAVLAGALTPARALEQLMGRGARPEA